MDTMEVSREILKLPEDHQMNGKIVQLTPLDHLHAGLITRFLLAFRNKQQTKLDLDRLKLSLKNTLMEYPELSGILKVGEKTFLSYSNQGVMFTVCKSNCVYEDFQTMDLQDREVFFASKCNFDPLETFIFQIKVTLLKDNSYILGLSVNHGLKDGHSNFQFINAWSHCFMSNESISDVFGKYKNCENTEQEKLMGHETTQKCEEYVFTAQSSYWQGIPYASHLVAEISKQKIENLKEEYKMRRSNGDPVTVSCNDIMSAIFSIAVTKCRNLKDKTPVKIRQIVNIRKKLGISSNYSGNAIVSTSICQSAQQMKEIDWWKLAGMIRKDLNNLDSKKIKSILGFLESASDWSQIKPNFDLSKDIFFVNRESFPIFHANFGQGYPNDITYGDYYYGIITFLPTANKSVTKATVFLNANEIRAVMNDPLLLRILS